MRTFSTVWAATAVTVVAMSSSACLRREVAHTIYISPASVTWTAVETDVRSDEGNAVERMAEEQDFVLAARAGRHPVADALRRLGGRDVSTSWLRTERPYGVMTAARFDDPAQLARAVFRTLGIDGDASLVREGCRTTFTARLNADSTSRNGDSGVEALLEDLDAYRFVLTTGRFVAADGFAIDGAVATPDPAKAPADGALNLSLAWEEEGRGCGPRPFSAPRRTS